MFNRVSQRVHAKIGVNEVTQDEEYSSLRITMKGMLEMCKESKKVLNSSIEGNKAWGVATKAMQKQLENCAETQGDHPLNAHLVSLTEQLGEAVTDFDQKIFVDYQKTLVDDCTAILTQYEAALKTGDALHETRKKKLDTYDYHRNDTSAKLAELEKKGREQSESESFQKKKRKEEEVKKEFDKTNSEAKELLTAAVKKRDTVLANYQQAYLRSTANYFGRLHDKFNRLHNLTLSPSSKKSQHADPVEQVTFEQVKADPVKLTDPVKQAVADPLPVVASVSEVVAPSPSKPADPPAVAPAALKKESEVQSITKEPPQAENSVQPTPVQAAPPKPLEKPKSSPSENQLSQPSPPAPPAFDSPVVADGGDGFLEQQW